MPQQQDQANKPSSSQNASKNLDPAGAPTKTVDIWFQSAYRTQLSLTSLADMKANIMISVNGLILTGLVATQGFVSVAPQLPKFIPIAMMVTCLASMIFAVIAALPRGSANTNAQMEHESGQGNLLYFNNQCTFSEQEFERAMIKLLHEPEQLQRHMSRHLYNLGCVLARKYRLLKISYTVFIGGLVIVSIMSAISSLLT